MDEVVSRLTVKVHYGGSFEMAFTHVCQACISLIVTNPCCDMSSIMTDFVEGEMCLWKSTSRYERLGRMQRRNTHSASAVSLVVVDVIGWGSLCSTNDLAPRLGQQSIETSATKRDTLDTAAYPCTPLTSYNLHHSLLNTSARETTSRHSGNTAIQKSPMPKRRPFHHVLPCPLLPTRSAQN